MDNTTIIGSAAAFFTTVAYIPQAVRVYKTRHTKDLSLGMFATFSFGISLWFVYGLLLHDPPLIAANLISLILSLYIVYMKVKHG